MRVGFDASEFEKEGRASAKWSMLLRDDLKNIVRAASMQTMRRVKARMPVDTGAARASWGTIWLVSDSGMTIVHGSPLPYIQRLNEGWSRKAPAGFIDVEAERALDDIERQVADQLAGLF